MNKVILHGNTGKEPELNYTQSGTPVCKTSLVTVEKWKDNNNEKKEKTTWHNLVIWGKLAEVFSKHVPKGTQIIVEGSIDNRSYEDKDGNKKYISEIKVSTFEFCGGKKNSDSRNEPEPPPREYSGDPNIMEDDLPF